MRRFTLTSVTCRYKLSLQKFDHGRVLFLLCQVERRSILFIFGVTVRFAGKEQGDEVGIARPRGEVKGGVLATLVGGIYVRTIVEKYCRDRRLLGHGREVQGRPTVRVL